MSFNGGYERRPYFPTAAPVAIDVERVPAAGLDTAYLGVEPPPSRPVGQVLQIVLALAAVVAVGRAFLLLVRASLDRQLTHGRTDVLVAQLHGNQTALNLVSVLGVGSLAAVVVTKFIWNRQRRPRKLARTHGEAYVELPMKAVLPAGLRYAMCGALALAVLGGIQGVIPAGAPLASFASHREWAAASSLAFAALWISHGALVVIANRRHDERVARSDYQRADPMSVPYAPPLAPL